VASAVGVGSTFTATLPRVYAGALPEESAWDLDAQRLPLLVVEDSNETLLLYEKMLATSDFQVLPARTLRAARDALAAFRPCAIILDILLRGEDCWTFLAELKRRPDTQEIPVALVSTVDDRSKALALGADACCVKPIDRQTLLQTVTKLVAPESMKRVLIVDDEEISRYVLRQHLLTPRHVISEAGSGAEALRMARTDRPDVICLDLMMPEVDGYEVLHRLKADPATRDIPVVIVTSKHLEESERRGLLDRAATILSKDLVSREAAVAAVDEAIKPSQRVA
jgi:CheY-like chemotaxis protein